MMGHPSHNAIAHANHRNRNHQDDLQVLPFGFPPLPSLIWAICFQILIIWHQVEIVIPLYQIL